MLWIFQCFLRWMLLLEFQLKWYFDFLWTRFSAGTLVSHSQITLSEVDSFGWYLHVIESQSQTKETFRISINIVMKRCLFVYFVFQSHGTSLHFITSFIPHFSTQSKIGFEFFRSKIMTTFGKYMNLTLFMKSRKYPLFVPDLNEHISDGKW